MPQSPDVQTVISDPKFLQLPAQEQKKVLLKIDPQFKSLPEIEQNQVVSRLHFPQPTKHIPDAPDNPLRATGRGFVTRAKDTAAGLGHLIADPPSSGDELAVEATQGRAALPVYRVGKGFVESEKEAAKQTKQSGKDTAELARQGHYAEAGLQGVKTGVTAASMLDPFATSSVANVNRLQDEGKNAEAVGQGLFDAMTLALGSKWGRGKIPNTGTLARLSKLAPKVVDVEGVKFIVPVGEAEESAVASKQGLKQSQYKKAGIGAKEFDEINRYNQAAAREVIRKVTQQSSGFIGPMPEGAGATLKTGANTVLEKARPMYKALDAVMKGPPEMRVISTNMGKVVQRAMKKVERFGVPMLPKDSLTQPFESYIQARSVLKRLAWKSQDPIVQRSAQLAVDEMDATIEKEMNTSGVSGMHDLFKQANATYAKGMAMERVGEAFDKSAPGVDSAMQHPALSPRPPELTPGSLAKELRSLDENGDLTRGLGTEQKKAFYQVADILDRQTSVGVPTGTPGEITLWHDVKKLATKPYQKSLVKIMTSPKGSQLINKLANAKVLSQAQMYSAQLSRMAENARAERWLPGQVQPPPGADSDTQ